MRLKSSLASPSTSSAACPTLCTASSSGSSAGIAARAAAVGTSWLGIASTPSSPGAGSKRTGASPAPGQITKPPWSAAATLSGCPSSSAASSNSGASSSYMWSAAASPATIAAALEPRPAATGISERIWKVTPSAGRSRSNARTHRFERSVGRPGTSECTKNSPVSSTSSSSRSESAAASTS